MVHFIPNLVNTKGKMNNDSHNLTIIIKLKVGVVQFVIPSFGVLIRTHVNRNDKMKYLAGQNGRKWRTPITIVQ